ncbi:hypothetical protein BN946_scf184940.g78 [Trametes cinnabarina]|uniref:Eukaryotic translation initiation factor 2A n=1 Tax=Pycnoporus cinnabarinus TaxID=5643 RepID=A0A060SCJ6_PYCCI|nr:hypothetical protein BN946_scf184940.g78 [Trametes cinnabarina]
MASQLSQQYAYRAQKSIGLVGGTPNYDPIDSFQPPDVPARTFKYSPDGRLFAYAIPTGVRIYQAESAQLLQELSLSNIVDISFSPRGTYLSTWERPIKLEDGSQHKNLRVFSVSTGEELVAFSQKSQEGWELQFTISESHAVRLVGQEIQVFRPVEWSKGVVDKLKVEGATSVTLSPGLNPSVAVFVAEKKGQPASVKIYSLTALAAPPTCQKTFFKAQRSQIKWNTLGTQVLVLTQTDVDQANKSYYGETGGLYLLSAAGNFDCRVALDKEGPDKRGRKKKGGKDGGKKDGAATPAGGEASARPSIDIPPNGAAEAVAANGSVPPTPGGEGSLDPTAKKIRNLNKKLKAIEELKEKQKKGERLEATQLKKIDTEADIRKELAGLGISS